MESVIKKKMRFPAGDVECRAVVPFQVQDVDRALAHVKDFDTCVQAGGNVGYWPLYLADKFKKVYTFEPDKENYACMVENIEGVDNIFHERAGLGDRNHAASLVGDRKNCGAYQIEEGGNDFPIVMLDNYNLSPSLLCLDIEGYELIALRGATETIKRSSPVIMLEDKGLSEKYGTKKGDVEHWLEQFGYKVVERIHRDVILVKQ